MNIINLLNSLKFRLIRLIESSPSLNILIYNNISLFKVFLPHEKDYYGITSLLKNRINDSIIDVGGNLGISSMGFRKLGFINKIYIFEPNRFIFNTYIKNKLIKKYKNIYGFNYALGNKDESKNFLENFNKDSYTFEIMDKIIDDVEEQCYVDHHHLTDLGQEIIAKKIEKNILLSKIMN